MTEPPTDADVTFYRTHGYWISEPFLPDDVLDTAEEGMRRIYAGESDHALPDGNRRYGWTPEHGDGLRKNDCASLPVDELARLVRHALLAATVARLAGVERIRLWHDQLLYKPSDPAAESAPVVGWHTDRQYWRTCSSAHMLTDWVPFHDVDLVEGPISFVDGSHLWDEDVVLDFFDQDLR